MYYASGYLTSREILTAGAACGAASLLIWGTAGMAWWRALGWW